MTRVALLSVALLAVAANAASFHTHYQRQINPFQNIPDVSTLGVCLSECAAVGENRARQTFGDAATLCTATFASQVGNCMQCLGRSPLTALLTNEIKQIIQDAKTSYESQCAAAGSSITVDIGTAFNVPSSSVPVSATSTSARASASVSPPTATLSSTGSPSPGNSSTGAGYIHVPSFGIAAAAAIGVVAAI